MKIGTHDFFFFESWCFLAGLLIHESQFSSVQSLSHVQFFATPWIAACQASLSITNSQSLLKLMSIELAMPPSLLILCYPLLLPQSLPASESFPMSQLFAWGGQSIGVSVSGSILPMNTQDWSLGWTGWISLQSKGLSRVFSNTTVQKHQFFSTQLSSSSNIHIHTWPLEKPYPWLDGPERLLLNDKTPGFLASGGDEFNPGPEMRLDRSELLCNKVLLKYKGDRENFWHRHQKAAERVPPF